MHGSQDHLQVGALARPEALAHAGAIEGRPAERLVIDRGEVIGHERHGPVQVTAMNGGHHVSDNTERHSMRRPFVVEPTTVEGLEGAPHIVDVERALVTESTVFVDAVERELLADQPIRRRPGRRVEDEPLAPHGQPATVDALQPHLHQTPDRRQVGLLVRVGGEVGPAPILLDDEIVAVQVRQRIPVTGVTERHPAIERPAACILHLG